MMYLFICNIVYAVLLFLAFVKGIEIGSRIKNNEKPIRTIKEIKQEKEVEKQEKEEQRKLDIIAQNIESYDGTGAGQKDIS